MAKGSGTTRTARRGGVESGIRNAANREAFGTVDNFSDSDGWYKSNSIISNVKVTETKGNIVSADVTVNNTYRNSNYSDIEEEYDERVYEVRYNKKTKKIEQYKDKYYG